MMDSPDEGNSGSAFEFVAVDESTTSNEQPVAQVSSSAQRKRRKSPVKTRTVPPKVPSTFRFRNLPVQQENMINDDFEPAPNSFAFVPTFRLVDLNMMAKLLWCEDCASPVSLRFCVDDKQKLYNSELKVLCHLCTKVIKVPLTRLGDTGSLDAYKQQATIMNHIMEQNSDTVNRCNELNRTLATMVPEPAPDTQIAQIKLDSPDYSMQDSEDDFEEYESSPSPESPETIIKYEEEAPQEPVLTRTGRLVKRTTKFGASRYHLIDSEEEKGEVGEVPMEVEENWSPAESDEHDSDEDEFWAPGDEEWDLEKLPRGGQEKCLYCDEEFSLMKKCIAHMKKCHPEFLQRKCPICNIQFKTWKKFKYHYPTHQSSKLKLCAYCGEMVYIRSYKVHIAKHTQERNYKCPHCPSVFLTSSGLNGHKQLHRPAMTCDLCLKVFNKKPRLVQHMTIHVKGKKYKCDICRAEFLHKDNRNTHRKNNHNYVCLICFRQFNCHPDEVQSHAENEHSEAEQEANRVNGLLYERITRFQCTECKVYKPSNQQLQIHLRKVHNRVIETPEGNKNKGRKKKIRVTEEEPKTAE
ncbi:zinc finger protein 184-like [Neocloeon triangulifer]|uniref:zinc finger protein 184-like n=1 Tax=Neocloeon triangulifer TaxID=2078957 RepID=UPI00286EE1CC|nr:zinc finger protein 184-like [Neocloeon triangulifer]